MIRNLSNREAVSYRARGAFYEHATSEEVARILEEVRLVQDGLTPLPPKKQTPTLQLRDNSILQKQRVSVAL